MQSNESQCEKISASLQNGERLTPLSALERFGCFRLGARIHDLRTAGINIKANRVQDGKKWFAEYYLAHAEQTGGK